MTHDPSTVRLLPPVRSVARIVIDQQDSKANILSMRMWADLHAAFIALRSREDLRGLIITSAKPGIFVAGADLRQLSDPSVDGAEIRKLITFGLETLSVLEDLPFPTLAAIDGATLGGGLELALACDWRWAGENTRIEFGLPEVKLGLIPGWGGTQRLARLVPLDAAVQMIISGDAVNTLRARSIGLIDSIVPSEDLLKGGTVLLEQSFVSGVWRERRKQRKEAVAIPIAEQQSIIAAAREAIPSQVRDQLPAPWAALDVVAAGISRPLQEALPFETETFLALAGTENSRNLIYVFFQKQRLNKQIGSNSREIRPAEIRQPAICGVGHMGSGIASVLLNKGLSIQLFDESDSVAQRGWERFHFKGEVRVPRNLNDLGPVDLLIEAIREDEAAKIAFLSRAEERLTPDGILVTNSSTLRIDRLAEQLRFPERFAGLHFFNPAEKMPLVEIVRGSATSDQTMVTLTAFVKRLGKMPMIVRDRPGFLINRILFPYLADAISLLDEGHSPGTIDITMESFGMPMGPLTLCDLIGMDVATSCFHVLCKAFPDRIHFPQRLAGLLNAGRLGRKTEKGFYDYDRGKRLQRDHEPSRVAPNQAIENRLVGTLRKAACEALEEGVVDSPDDVNIGLILGIGWPAFRGGILR